MKTLDEVIKGMEHCHEGMCIECPYQFEPMDFDCITQCQYTDALHYLKEYQTLQYGYVKAMADLEDNPPLTWDELCKMEDTPVWLEWSSDGAWVLIANKVDNDLEFFRYCDDRIFVLTRDDYEPDKWQAYRKERKATGGNLIPEPKSKKIGDDTEIKWREK